MSNPAFDKRWFEKTEKSGEPECVFCLSKKLDKTFKYSLVIFEDDKASFAIGILNVSRTFYTEKECRDHYKKVRKLLKLKQCKPTNRS